MRAGRTVGDIGIRVGTLLRVGMTQAQVRTVGIPEVGIILTRPLLLQLRIIGPAAAMFRGNGQTIQLLAIGCHPHGSSQPVTLGLKNKAKPMKIGAEA